jgi:hypothetical protein
VEAMRKSVVNFFWCFSLHCSPMLYPNAQLPIWCVLKIIQKCQIQLGLLFEQSIIFMSCAYFCRAKTSYIIWAYLRWMLPL